LVETKTKDDKDHNSSSKLSNIKQRESEEFSVKDIEELDMSDSEKELPAPVFFLDLTANPIII